MGLIESIFGSEEEEESEFEDEFQEPEEDFEIEEPEEPEEEMKEEWETAYRFSEDILEEEGFADMQEFTMKAMMVRLNRSNMFRDRIKSGVETMGMITESMKDIQDLRGQFGNERELKSYLDDVQAANELMDEIDRLDGKEEQMAQEIMSLGHELVGAVGSSSMGTGGNVSTGVERTGEEI